MILPFVLLCVISLHAAPTARVRAGDIELKNSVEDLRGASVKALDLRLPADGLLEVDLLVHQGPGITMHVISRAGATAAFKVNQFRIYPDFSANEATTTRKSAWLPRGDYYLTLINSNTATPVKVRVFARFRAAARETNDRGD